MLAGIFKALNQHRPELKQQAKQNDGTSLSNARLPFAAMSRVPVPTTMAMPRQQAVAPVPTTMAMPRQQAVAPPPMPAQTPTGMMMGLPFMPNLGGAIQRLNPQAMQQFRMASQNMPQQQRQQYRPWENQRSGSPILDRIRGGGR